MRMDERFDRWLNDPVPLWRVRMSWLSLGFLIGTLPQWSKWIT